MKFFYALLISVLSIQASRSQDIDWTHYQMLKSYGNLPADFTTLSSAKFEKERQDIDVSAARGIRKSQEQFFLKSNFLIDELLHSGRVVFGDPVTQYLNNIKDNLLMDDPALANKIRIYTLRSTTVNAFTTDNGVVLVTTGLVAQVENEAQLAFVLAHEFQHYIKKHSLTEYVETRQMEKGRGIYKNLNPNDIELRAFQYSKELETEADKIGFDLYKKSAYSIQAAQGVFDVLLYSYLPFDEVAFRKDYFNERGYRVPDEYFLDVVAPVTAVDDYDDIKNTHPNIKTRRSDMLEATRGVSDEGRKKFIQPEDAFRKIQDICRYEQGLLYLNDCEFPAAFYTAYLLLQNDSNNIFLKKMMTRSLYAEALYKNGTHSAGNEVYYKDVEGESEQVFYLLDKMPRKEFNVLALRVAWMTHLADPRDETIMKMCSDLAASLVTEYSLSEDDFREEYVAESDTVMQPTSDVKNISKIEKIKSSESVKASENPWWKFAFVNFKHDDSFGQLFVDVKRKEEPTPLSHKKSKPKDFALGIDRAVIVNPLYLKVDETAREPVRYMAAEQLKLDLQDKIKSCAAALDLSLDYLETMQLSDRDADKFNDLAILNNWIAEELDHDDIPVINSNNEEMLRLLEKYKTEHFVWLGVISFKEKKENVGLRILAGVFFPPYLPFAIAAGLKPEYETAVFTLVANGKNGTFELEFENVVDSRDLSSIQKSNLYFILQQIKNKTGKK